MDWLGNAVGRRAVDYLVQDVRSEPLVPGNPSHHSLYMPRDFDISPYFEVVKPTLVQGFDYRACVWAERRATARPEPSEPPAPEIIALRRN